jgi:DNA-binding NarL/FixJ family response regulator
MSLVRILVVDDLEPWRRFVSSTLQKQPDLRVISDVSDGLEAVQKAEELRPDLIVLDIGLPKLNGIEAARRIRKLVPKSRILFLSQESCDDVVDEAFRLGAWGYVVKTQAGSELLVAVEAVLQGKQFASRELARGFTGVMDAPERLRDSAESYHLFVDESSDGIFCVEDLIGKRLAEMVTPDDPQNIELTRAFIRSGYRVLQRKSYELDSQGRPRVFLNSMTGVVVDGKLVLTWGVQSDVTERA